MSQFKNKTYTYNDKYKKRLASGTNARLQREKIFVNHKENYVNKAVEEKEFEELEECTFGPDRDATKAPNEKRRDHDEFLNDQQKFLE